MRLTFSSNNNTQRGFKRTSPPPRRAQEPGKKRQKSIDFPENNRPKNQKILRSSTKIATKSPMTRDKNTQQTHLMTHRNSTTTTSPEFHAITERESRQQSGGGETKQRSTWKTQNKHQISKKHVGSKYKPATRREGEKRRKRQRQRDTVTEERETKEETEKVERIGAEPETQSECAAQATLLPARHLCCCCSVPKHMRGEEEEGGNMRGGLRWRPKRVYNAPLRDRERGREREEGGRAESARAGGVGNNTRRVFIKYLQMPGAWMLVPSGYLTSTSLGLYLGLALGTPLGSFFFFLFPLFWGVIGSLFSYVVALLAIIKTKKC
jgi:hypothetical protein